MVEHPLPEVEVRSEEVYKCVNCGLCQAVCPTYLAEGNEGLTARGKIVLLRRMLEGEVEPSSGIADLFDDCLTCYACRTVCPAGVRTDRLWTAARQDLAPLSRRSRLKRAALRWSIGRPRTFARIAGTAGRLAGFNPADHRRAALGKLPLTLYRGAPHIREMEPEYAAVGEQVGVAALFPGCSTNLSTPWVADAVVKLLRYSGYRVVVPREHVCCGAPAINNSDWDTARTLAMENLRVFQGVEADVIISPDGTCAGALKHDYRELFRSDGGTTAQVAGFSERVGDLSRVLAEAVRTGRLKFPITQVKVTVHDSCHVTHYGEGNRWREVLAAVPGLEVVEMRRSDHCCGYGGSYALFHRGTSLRIASRKVVDAAETGADFMLVGSPGCLMRLLSVTADRMEVQHLATFLANRLTV